MRWNCPHCEELVTAGIDFENTKKAYVRCAKCNGMALVHRSAVLADYVRARRMEEEAQLESEIRLKENATITVHSEAMENQIRNLTERLHASMQASVKAAAAPMNYPSMPLPPPPNATMTAMMLSPSLGLDLGMTPGMPSPFTSSFEEMDEDSTQETIKETIVPIRALPMNDVAAAPPKFNYAIPPAFLMEPVANPIETLDRNFPIGEETSSRRKAVGEIGEGELNIRPTIALWIAATLAIASGTYLYHEGRRALYPPHSTEIVSQASGVVTRPVQADVIQSKANSAIRSPDGSSLVRIRVSRAILRRGPAVTTPSVQTLDLSTVASLLEEKEGWIKIGSPEIQTTDGTAWVRADLVTRVPN